MSMGSHSTRKASSRWCDRYVFTLMPRKKTRPEIALRTCSRALSLGDRDSPRFNPDYFEADVRFCSNKLTKGENEFERERSPFEVGPLARDVTFIYAFRGQLPFPERMTKPHRSPGETWFSDRVRA